MCAGTTPETQVQHMVGVFREGKNSTVPRKPQTLKAIIPMEMYLDRIGPLKVETIAKKKGQKRKSNGHGKGPSAKKGTPLRNKTETMQENSEGDRCKHERTAMPLKDITIKLQNVLVPGTVEGDAALNEHVHHTATTQLSV
ncbi:hypothetical protein NDU88_000996 [Pleurodeles waltl]|uniref:Uncharacterized protein n=1 Tax=Pleurodeles waltl TaxID=8319 RepID=A0AAV7PB97_PLEWA|nr:hypothetical protein NDU88_000996 [Pleurodeles waltl]